MRVGNHSRCSCLGASADNTHCRAVESRGFACFSFDISSPSSDVLLRSVLLFLFLSYAIRETFLLPLILLVLPILPLP